jgi:hypothetical protein
VREKPTKKSNGCNKKTKEIRWKANKKNQTDRNLYGKSCSICLKANETLETWF